MGSGSGACGKWIPARPRSTTPRYRRLARQPAATQLTKAGHHRRTLPYAALLAFLILLPYRTAPAQDGIRIPDDPSHAWLAPLAGQSLLLAVEKAGDRMIAAGERGHILYRQPDNGWHQAMVPTQALLTGLSFSDERHGWAVGHDGIILGTADGGRTWRKLHEAVHEQRPLLDVRFRDKRTGFAAGAYGYFLRTEDGGATWRPGLVDEEHDFHLNAIATAPGDRIYIAAEAGHVYRSDDGGDHWHTLKAPYDGSFFGVHPLGGDRVMVFGLRGHLFVSEDAGGHWRPVATGTRAALTSAIELGDGRLLLTGHAGTLLLADADLQQIRHARLPERKALSDAVEIAPNRVLLVGEEGVRSVDLCRVFSCKALHGK
uniref:Photosynthesis system II assembly factor Ycf48/Hcf136-like domain-containing protein n=1 Tax=Candidatus Kentrum sp. FM TaxID=2126340 RepID=A0A450T7N5_9GAMM|nr:MAG: Uncharacterized protein BECKFM1743C_GA0114222_103072 [Candidatus Kentron sp. FM]VFJ62578.1 MAG: Uncharacterized protein BECKFM1743A_GA0114220_103093 [Candidatus Kentron sp. FM]VFK14035.1 MAG: Uncharacterized protein BECKFM1743B_GA0114221_103023 [Candidatus Kentron sp. FM]